MIEAYSVKQASVLHASYSSAVWVLCFVNQEEMIAVLLTLIWVAASSICIGLVEDSSPLSISELAIQR